MTLVKVNNRPAHKGFDNVFNDFFNGFPSWTADRNTVPSANVHETQDAYHLELNVPGRTKEDFAINIDNGLLTIKYEKKEEKKDEQYKTVRREFSFESFQRSFSVDDNIDVEKVEAKYENGVLKLLLPKKEEAKVSVRQISVQ